MALWINRLDALVAFTLAMRAAATLAHAALARRGCGFVFVPVRPDAATSRELQQQRRWLERERAGGIHEGVGRLLVRFERRFGNDALDDLLVRLARPKKRGCGHGCDCGKKPH